MLFFAGLMDLFFLRRFLDKDYITNGIVYTGKAHSEFYILSLVKYFNFKVTHTAYSSLPNMDKLTETIKAQPNIDGLFKLLNPPIMSQCIHADVFPELFI